MQLLAALLLAVLGLISVQPDRSLSKSEEVFFEAWRIVGNSFYDANMNGVDWDAVRRELQPRAAAAKDAAGLSGVINEALGRLKASHTGHFTPDQREYYEILDIFFPEGVSKREGSAIRPGPVEYAGIGLASTVIAGKTFVLDVYAGGPADAAGIRSGDELVGVQDGPWGDVAPFRGREGQETTVTIRRTPDPNTRMEITLRPVMIRPRQMFLASIDASAEIVERGGKRIGYVRIRSYAHADYHERLKELLRTRLKDADALVIDIRGGWGGASPQYMDIFNPVAPVLTHKRRDGEPGEVAPTWQKPVALLIDHGTRSGKEMLAYAFKKHKLGVLIGERTAGAVLGGTARPLSDGSLLFVAVTDVRIDGVKLEGEGVTPDIEVKRDLPYSKGADGQREAAIDAMAKAVR